MIRIEFAGAVSGNRQELEDRSLRLAIEKRFSENREDFLRTSWRGYD